MRKVELDDIGLHEKGGYVLLIMLKERSEIKIGRLGVLRFDSGYYAYIGSALGGLRQRISRHLRKEKKLHWHIDYLLEKASVENIIVCQSGNRIECDIASEIGSIYNVIRGFGSSDCQCPGHLFYSSLRFDKKIMRKLMPKGAKSLLMLEDQDNGS